MKKNWLTLTLLAAFSTISFAQGNKRFPQTKVTTTINSPADSVFNYVVPVDLSHIFKRYKNLPGIVNTSIKEGWVKPGLTRTIYFEDGSTSKESLLTVVPFTSFSYKNENFSSSLKRLAKSIEGSWQFTPLANGETNVEWTYRIVPKNFLARGIINLMLIRRVNVYIGNALDVIKSDLERNNPVVMKAIEY